MVLECAAAWCEGLLGPAKGGHEHLWSRESILQKCCCQAAFCVWWLLKLVLECVELYQGMHCTARGKCHIVIKQPKHYMP